MSPDNHQFAAFLTECRKAKQLSGPQLAELVGVTKSNIFYWESGRFLPKPEVIPRLAEALDVDPDEFYELGGFHVPERLPSVAPYLRSKYAHLPKKALKEAEDFFKQLEDQYGGPRGNRSK